MVDLSNITSESVINSVKSEGVSWLNVLNTLKDKIHLALPFLNDINSLKIINFMLILYVVVDLLLFHHFIDKYAELFGRKLSVVLVIGVIIAFILASILFF